LVANVPGIVYRVHLKEQYRMKFFNDMLEPMTGYKACELKTGGVCSIDPLILSEDRVIVLNVVKSAVEENKPFEVEYRLRHKNGSIRHFLERGRPVPGSEGEPAFIDGVILDITTRKHMEEALRESEERFRSVLENSLDAAYRRNLKTDRYDYVSSVFEQIIGLTPDELRDVSTEEALQRVHPDDRQQVAQELERNLRGGKQLLEYRFKGKDGEYKWLADTISVFSDRDGHLSYRVGVARDVTARKQVEAALKESQTRLLQITENINEVFWLTNPDWTELLYVSPGYERVWGKPCESLYSQPLSWLEAVLEEDRPAILAKLEEGFCDQETMTLPEYRIVRPDGTQRCIQDRAWPIRDERGNIQRLAGIAEDITERKLAEEALQKSESRYRSLFENSLDAIFITAPDGKIRAASPAACAMFGMTEEEIIQAGRDGLVDPSDPRLEAILEERARSGKVHGELRFVRKDGTTFEGEGSSVILEDGTKAFVIVKDITERKRAEQALLESEGDRKYAEAVETERRRLFDVLETLPVMICLLTPDHHVAFANRSFRERFGESNGHYCYEYCFGQGEPCGFCESYKVLKTGQPHHWEFTGPGGSIIDAYDFPFTDVDGSPMILEMDVDITERRKLEEDLTKHREHLEELVGKRTAQLEAVNAQLQAEIAEREQGEEALRIVSASNERHLAQLNALVNQMTEGLVIFDQEGNLLDGNPAAQAMHGFEDSSVLRGQNLSQLTTVLELSDLEGKPLPNEKWPIGRVLRGETFNSYEVRVRRRDTGKTWIGSYGGTPVRDSEGKLIWCILTFRDVTEYRQMEGELRELAQRLSYHVDNSPLAVIEWGPDMRLNRWTGAAERVFGWRADEVLGKRMEDFRWVYKEDEARVVEVSYELESGVDPKRFSTNRNYRKDGSVVHCEWYNSSLMDESGKLRSILSLVLDVTERVRLEEELRKARDSLELRVEQRTSELKAANRALREYAAKLERLNKELQSFAFIASHDLQEPLRKIQTFGSMIESRSGHLLPEKSRDFLARMQKAAKMMQDRLTSLLVYSRLTTKAEPFKETDLNRSVKAALSNLAPLIQDKKGKVEVGELPCLEADRSQMIQLFQNLIGNALKFQGNKRPPLIKIYARTVEGAKEVEAYRIFVEDNGIGFDEKYLDKVFAPFQRLNGRSEYEGVGMGLAICRKIVERHGGEITAQSEPGKGSTFVVTLPARLQEG
jgi:PAS domain S-box-containing protein